MKTFSVTARGLASVQVKGPNWIVALGAALHELGRVDVISRLACEVLPNGTVIARDVASGTGYIVHTTHGTPAIAGRLSASRETAQPIDMIPLALGGEASNNEDRSEIDEISIYPTEELEIDEIVELPPDAITPLAPDELQLAAIDHAESALMACQMALVAARERSGAESGAVLLEERGFLRFAAVQGPHSRKLVGVRLPLGTGVAGYAMKQRRSMVVSDAHDDPRHCGEVDALTGYQTREIAVAPFESEGVLGVIEVMNLPDGRRFGEVDIDSLTEIGDALALRLAR